MTDGSIRHDLVAAHALRQLAGLDPVRIEPFVKYSIESVQIRPLLRHGMICKRREPDPAYPGREFLILVASGQSAEQEDITLWHELIHAHLLILNIPPEFHNEEEIEACARDLATKHPGVLRAICGRLFALAN